MAKFCLEGLLSIFWTICFVQAQCYYPGGTIASDQKPCDPGASTSFCCPAGWACFSNNLCVVTIQSAAEGNFPVGTSLRGTCTSTSWDSSTCGGFCLDGPDSANNGSLQSCGNNIWCCGFEAARGTCDCKTGGGTFSLPIGTAQTTIDVAASSATPTPSVNTLSSSPSATALASSSATATANSSASVQPVPITHKSGFKAGISILVVVVIGALAAAGFFLWRRMQRRKNMEAAPQIFDDSDLYRMHANTVLSNVRLEPDPYQIPSLSTTIPREPSRNGGLDPMRFSPPINDPYQYPYTRS